jgi:putative ATP-binding cassette transporter
MASIDRRAWSRFVRVTKPFFTSETRWRAWGGVAVLIALLFSLTGLNVANSYVGRHFMTAVAEGEAGQYLRFAVLYLAVFAVSTVIAVFYQFVQSRFALSWRQWLTQHFIDQYLSSQAYYRLSHKDEIDNPDQRISQDINTFTQMAVSFFVSLLNSTVTILAFTAVLWSISPWLLLAALVYAVIGWVLTIVLGRRLVGLNNLQLKREADLRYELVRTREYANTIALKHGEKREQARLRGKLRSVVENYGQIIAVVRNVGFFTSMFRYLVPLIPVLIVAPRYIRGEIQFGVITQAGEVFARILDQATSLITQQFQSLSEFAAVVTRLGTLLDTLTEAVRPKIEVVEDDSRVAYERLTLRTPKEGRVLISALSIEVPHGRRLLIEGPNGAGKTALFRATAGIWSDGEGRILRPNRERMMVLPQRPHTVPGSLRDQLLYGLPEENLSDDRLLAALRAVRFESALERVGGLDAEHNWSNVLSAGEQQLLDLARLLVGNPPFALLDQAVSALDPQRAKQLYQVLAKTTISYISVCDCTLLQEYHDTVLELQNDGQWKTRPAQRRVGAASTGS